MNYMADIINKFYRKIANNGNDSGYGLVGTIGVNGIELDILQGCTESTNGQQGLVPAPSAGYQNRILTGDATWKTINNLISGSGMIKNNLTTASSGSILDAYQGKVLNDKITSTNSTVSTLSSNLSRATSRITALENYKKTYSILTGIALTDNVNGYYRIKNVTFSKKFSSTPIVFTSFNIPSGYESIDTSVTLGVNNITTSGCRIVVANQKGGIDARTYSVTWIAIGKIA